MQPSILYKYRDDSSRTEEIITNGKVWLSTPDQLNDPMECRTGKILEGWKRQHIREMENAQMAGFIISMTQALKSKQPFFSLQHRAAKRWLLRFKRLKTRKEKYIAIHAFHHDHGNVISRPAEIFKRFERQLARVGVFSLTECPDNQLMWAHYAASHAGIAIGFKREPAGKLESGEHTIQVIYDDVKPTFDSGFMNQLTLAENPNGGMTSEQRISFNDPTFRAAFSTKPIAWGYEKEWRYVEERSGLFPWPGPVVALVFGLKMPKDRRKHYANIVSRSVDYPVEFSEISMAANNASVMMIPWTGQ